MGLRPLATVDTPVPGVSIVPPGPARAGRNPDNRYKRLKRLYPQHSEYHGKLDTSGYTTRTECADCMNVAGCGSGV